MGDGSICYATAKNWFKKFRDGKEDLTNKECLGRPPTININPVLPAIEADPTLSTRMLGDEVDCSHTQVARILHEAAKKLYFASKTPDFYARGIDLLPIKWQHVIDNNEFSD
ncbi:HTH_48 domain-containing protein [Meloidogyne graminicola]|uniref:HTH_48 domain-containing protein n=1 Tax=Meloidogyne graminicola TaxID=189291 RepID=A0A8S9Z867_9BILA|nr:HTH_48 domain-containing protein [Meloidogyne graminicola]